jgi:UDP-N-acetylmuramyl pentapeptide phosphotransferase/UDP-N-acetylglucosamine-1-phosphate transferase
MPEFYVIFFTLISTITINYFLKKNNFLLDKKYSSHKSLASSDEVPLSGGIIFLLSILIFYEPEFFQFRIILLAIFLIGMFSDINFISSPIKRITLQIMVISVFLYVIPTYIHSVRWDFFDYYLQNSYLGYFFTLLCLTVLINGSNFMDGLNIFVVGYFLIVTYLMFNLSNDFNLNLDFYLIKIVLAILLVIFVFNFFGLLFLGDGGAYLISFVLGYTLINFSNDNNEFVSPYFTACMLWYPAYENLFSITRKKINNKSATKADKTHLHQLLYIFFKSKLLYSDNVTNTLTGFTLVFFNLIVLLIAAKFFNDSKNLILLLLISITFYNLTYYYLKKNIRNN